MKNLIVGLERNGVMQAVGRISGEKEPFRAAQTKTFFEGLLPEGFTRRTVAQWLHVAEEDYLSILHGQECLGALCITEEGEVSEASYTPITEQEIRELATEGAKKSGELVTKTYLSLTVASGKVGLY